MQHLDLAPQALALFSQYARSIEAATQGASDPQLVLFSDGSGNISDLMSGAKYLDFSDFQDLIAQLQQQVAG